jgi:hypothetical protein
MFYPSIQIATSYQSNIIYVCSGGFTGKPLMSKNFGQSWQTVSLPDATWTGVDCSSDGMIAYFAADHGFIYKTTNYGSSWEQLPKLQKKRWRSVRCSSNGNVVTITTVGEGIYQTKDGGETWSSINLYGNNDSFFTAICGSTNGSINFTGISQGPVFVIENVMNSSNVTSVFGKDVDNKQSFNCPKGHQISGFSAVTGGWMDQIQFKCSNGSKSEKYGGKNRNFTDGDQNVNVNFASNTVKGFSINDTPNDFISSMGLIYDNGTKSSMMGGSWIRNNGTVECPSGKRIVGVDVNYDHYVSRIGIKCDNV